MSFIPDYAPRFGNPVRTYRHRSRIVAKVPATTNLLSNKRVKIEEMAKPRTKMNKRRPRRYRRGRLKRFVPRALAPRTKIIRCKAVNYLNLQGTGALAMNPLQLNSIDDPSNSNGQPLGYDQWKALYKKAIVIGSKLVVKFHNRGSYAAMVGIWPAPLNQGSTALTDYEYYGETPGCKSRLLSPEMDHTVMFHKVSVKKHLGRKDVKDDDRLYVDLITETPPTDLCWWHVFAQAVDQAAAYAVDAVVTCDFIVLLTDPIIPARSVET